MDAPLDPARFEALTFDCYGTLIDWETGLLAALETVLGSDPAMEPPPRTPDELLEAFARHETALEAEPYRPYREILEATAEAIALELGVTPTPEALRAFGGSVAEWPAFPDSAGGLARLARRFRLGVITNCDDDLFAASEALLGSPFELVVTAQQVGAYKPATRGFEVALERLHLPVERVLHVAQSLFHDHVPAKSLGFATAWVDRREGQAGTGATPPAEARPDLVVPDIASLAEALLGEPIEAAT